MNPSVINSTPAKAPRRGSVLVYALILIAMSSLIFVGWIQIMIVRGNYVNTIEDAMQRRAGVENGVALLQQYVMGNVFGGTAGGDISVEVANGWGGVEILEWSGSPFASVADLPFTNHFNPGGGGGFGLSITAVITSGGVDEEMRSTEVRRILVGSRSPILGGNLVTFQRPTMVSTAAIAATGPANVTRGALIWRPNSPNTYAFHLNRFASPDVEPAPPTMSSGGGSILVSNVAFPAIYSTDFEGSLNVIDNFAFPQNSLVAKIGDLAPLILDGTVESNHGTLDGEGVAPIRSDGEGTITVRLGQQDHLYFFLNNLETLRLEGQTTAATTRLVFIVSEGPGADPELQEVIFTGNNSRPVLLAVKKNNPTELLWNFVATTPAWRVLAVLENTPLQIVSSGQVVMQGGIRTDRSVNTTGASINVVFPGVIGTETLLDRHAWMETYAP